MTAKITSPQETALLRLVKDALDNNKEAAQRLLTRGDEFKKKVRELTVDDGETPNQRAARKIMGGNFLGIPEVTEHFGAIGSANLLDLQKVPFSKEALKACATTHILVADVGLSLLDVRSKVDRALFYSHEDSRYNGQEFAKRTEQALWWLTRKTPVENSTSKIWSEQQELIANTDEVPSARQVVYTTILNYLVRGERLFENVYVRTCDVDSHGGRVGVGDFDSDGLDVSGWHDDSRSGNIGVSAARKS